MATDHHRPRYHFLPPANWMNDPNGLIEWGGQYHLFYQYNPRAPVHRDIHWGHAVSTDLVHWTHLPIALAPERGSPDADGCYSGCAVNADGTPTLVYSGHQKGKERPCLATSHDGLITWEKHAENPIIAAPPPDLDLVAFRDHCVWREDGEWFQIIGAGIKGAGGTALLYHSRDLTTWSYLNPILVGDAKRRLPLWTGSMWECPDLFPLGDRHVLVVSVWDKRVTYHVAHFLGVFADQRFTPDHVGVLDQGASFYAPQTMADSRGRRLMWGWLREARGIPAQRAAGWSGVMSLPRLLTTTANGLVAVAPVPELAVLRGEHFAATDVPISPKAGSAWLPLAGPAVEIQTVWEPGGASYFGLDVACSPDGGEATRIGVRPLEKQLVVDRTRSSRYPDVARDIRGGPLDVAPHEPVKLHVFVDGSVIEVFANDRLAHATRVYPVDPASTGIRLFAEGGRATVRQLDVWQMQPAWSTAEAYGDARTGAPD